MRRLAFTFVELLLVIVLMGVLMGALVGLYGFATHRAGISLASGASQVQAKVALDEIQKIVQLATSCSTTSSGSSSILKCVMPATCSMDSSGYPNSCTPTGALTSGAETWGTKDYVWFYTSDSTGRVGNAGTVLWRALTTTSSLPTVSNADSKWSLYYNGSTLRPFLVGETFTVNATTHLVTISLTSSMLQRSFKAPATSDPSSIQSTITLSRSVYWRNQHL